VTAGDYDAVRTRLDELLRGEGARIDASYFCPHHPDFTGPCECRKPATLLFRQAAAEHGLDLTRSAFVGDRWRDVAPSLALGGRGILISGPATPPEDVRQATAAQRQVVPSLDEAVALVLRARTSALGPRTSPL
jgi:D-glycero-D-manno-heptose 1,7-bisphosphate phosphatase